MPHIARSTRVLAALTGALTLGSTVPAAHAATTLPPGRLSLTVTSPACGAVQVRNTGTRNQDVQADAPGRATTIAPGQVVTWRGMAGGEHHWTAQYHASTTVWSRGLVQVARCAGGAVVPRDGDEDGDGRADLLAVQAGTGRMFYYRWTGRGLARGVQVGSGWNNILFAQRVGQVPASLGATRVPAGRRLLAVGADANRTLYSYAAPGGGRVTGGTNLQVLHHEEDRFSVVPADLTYSVNSPMLLSGGTGQSSPFLFQQSADQPSDVPPLMSNTWAPVVRTIGMHDLDGDHWADVLGIRRDGTLWAGRPEPLPNGATHLVGLHQVGHGWGSMDLVMSPGSVDGDELSDLVARRHDGNLYLYRNLGGRFAAPQLIGRNWQSIRLLA